MSRTVILGCGPAGLAAAAAAVSSGHEAIIISNVDEPSTLYGCQYLHAPIPGYEDVAQVRVTYSLIGTPEEYRAKVYGGTWKGKVSPEDFAGDHDAWDIRETYARLWTDLIGSMKVGLIKKYIKHGLIPFTSSLHPDLIVSTIPAQALCQSSAHQFKSYTIYANGSTSPFSGTVPQEANSVICDGTSEHPWYRVSNVFGYRTTEWPALPPRASGAVAVVKPLWTDCNCHPWVLRAGRYGAWEKARLVHEVYPAVKAALEPSDAYWVPGEGGSAWRM
jgi:hypothetical protein